MSLTQSLHRNGKTCADKFAIICGGERRTHAELLDRVGRLAAGLQGQGLSVGDRIAVLSLNSIPSVELCFAAWWIGAVVCPLNTRWSPPEIAFALADCRAKCLFLDDAHASLLPLLREQGDDLHRIFCIGDDGGDGTTSFDDLVASDSIADARVGGDTLAALLYTGGTTGRSKGVMLTHQNLLASVMSRLADNASYGDRVGLIVTPLFHVGGIARLLPHLYSGGRAVIAPKFRADDAIRLIEREGVTDLALVPSMLQMVLDEPGFNPQQMRLVQRVHYGAAPISISLLQRTAALLPWVGFVHAYGMTESACIGTLGFLRDPTDRAFSGALAQSAGQACSGIELRVVDPEGMDVPAGVVGEILLRGPMITPGYWNRPEETATALRNGWLHTGDGGRLDDFGYLYVVDRLKDVIVTGGENVYSAEVENVLAQHPDVAGCCVVGVPNEQWGEAVHAVVVVRPGAAADEASLQQHCRELLANYKCPKTFEFPDVLPLTAAGKVAKNVLRETHWRGRPGKIS